MKKNNTFLAMWDMYGLECIFNLTKLQKEYDLWHKEETVRILKGLPATHCKVELPLEQLKLRATVNSHRHYEIYTFVTPLLEREVRFMFDECPQVIVESIRNVGVKIYSDRTSAHQIQRIT